MVMLKFNFLSYINRKTVPKKKRKGFIQRLIPVFIRYSIE